MSKKLITQDIAYKAERFREHYGLGKFASIDFDRFLMRTNVITVYKPLSDDFIGMSILHQDTTYRFMLINSNQILSRQRFTMAHELYHLFVQEDFHSHICTPGNSDYASDPEEYKADVFASNLLLPENGVLEIIPEQEKHKKNEITRESIFKIHQYFGVSVKAVIMRLRGLDLVDNSYFDTYSSELKSTAVKLGYNTKLYESTGESYVIGDYASLAMRLYESGKISESHYLELMNAIGLDPYKNEHM
ncbi:MAG: ImmA/IrrE family metallo-endopeptidase [Bacteroidota bacterium]|nr:ImmA/IrrE family metallo-endopeptidase [Bacteroidota bacterium]